LINNLYRK